MPKVHCRRNLSWRRDLVVVPASFHSISLPGPVGNYRKLIPSSPLILESRPERSCAIWRELQNRDFDVCRRNFRAGDMRHAAAGTDALPSGSACTA